jgi:D-glycero-D-manno-heptose 1,7-bisphosphate phosphatase
MKGKSYAILDRDGTVIVHHPYLSDAAQVELLPGAAAGLRAMRDLGLGLVVATNQSGVGRGMFDRAAVEGVHRRMVELLAAQGVRLDGIFVCPHTPQDRCPCRKPATGLVQQAVRDTGLDPAASYVIGDNWSDIEMGSRVGATTFLVLTGLGREARSALQVEPSFIVEDLVAAARTIRDLVQPGAS